MSTEHLKTSRNPAETRKNILEVAFLEIYRHGFKGTSTNSIIDKMELTRGAFFHHFPTKDELGYALIDEVLHAMILDRWIQPVEKYDDPVSGILKNFARLIEEHHEDHLLCGCPLNNFVQEMSDRPDFHKRIQAVMEMWIDKTQEILSLAKRTGHMKKNVNTRQLAEFIVACEEAAFSMGKALKSRAAMMTVYKSLKNYLELLNKG
jgi:AcrR family transcriptional regulator